MTEAVYADGASSVVLTDVQAEIQSVAREFLRSRGGIGQAQPHDAGSPPADAALSKQLASLGWTGLTVDEEYGGSGLGLVERCLILEEMGAVLFSDAFLSTGIAADALALAGAPALVAKELEALASGAARFALVDAAAQRASHAAYAERVGEETLLTGRFPLVLDAGAADVLLVPAAGPNGEIGLYAVDATETGVTHVPVPTIDPTRSFADVSLKASRGRRLDETGAAGGLRIALDHGAIALGAELIGAARACLEMTIEYLKERRQFGAPIGSFQAIKHRLASSHVLVEAARETVYLAADVATSDVTGAPAIVAAAKAYASDAFTAVAAESIQLHGGIGFTWEHHAHLFYRRALLGASLLGSPVEHRERLTATILTETDT
jgi:alkylation response protein AidB-like acyl-CoA dehydrogenase